MILQKYGSKTEDYCFAFKLNPIERREENNSDFSAKLFVVGQRTLFAMGPRYNYRMLPVDDGDIPTVWYNFQMMLLSLLHTLLNV